MGTTKQDNLKVSKRSAFQIMAVEAYLPEATTSKTTITFDTPDATKALEQVFEAIHRAETAGAERGVRQALHSVKRAVTAAVEAEADAKVTEEPSLGYAGPLTHPGGVPTGPSEEEDPEPTGTKPTAADAQAHQDAKKATEAAILSAVQGDTTDLEAIAAKVGKKARSTKASKAVQEAAPVLAELVIPTVTQGAVKDGAKVTFELSGSMAAALSKAGLIPAVELEAKGRGQAGTVTLKAAAATELAKHLGTTEVPGLPARRAARIAKRIQAALDAKAAK